MYACMYVCVCMICMYVCIVDTTQIIFMLVENRKYKYLLQSPDFITNDDIAPSMVNDQLKV